MTCLYYSSVISAQEIVDRPSEHSCVVPSTINDVPSDFIAIHFTGRDEELNRIDDILRSGSQGRSPNRCAIYGMHGIGKTQLALQYAKLSFDQCRYSHTFWIQATTIAKLNFGLTNILGLVGHVDRDHQDQNVKLRSARLWLESPDKDDVDWLIVFDNVERETLAFLRTHLPRQNVRGNVLFTTRTRDIAEALVTGRQDSILELGALDLPMAMKLYFRDASVDASVVDRTFEAKVEQIVRYVGRLPLAISQAASFMNQSQKTVDEMSALYKGKQKIDVSFLMKA
jgi:hypothetical protein